MSVNKTIGGLSVLSSANIKGCFSLPVWDSNAQTTKSACISDLVSAGGNIFTAGTGICSSLRVNVNNTASGDCSASLGGSNNLASGAFSAIVGGTNNCATSTSTFIGGGNGNTALGICSISVGGNNNLASCTFSSVLGGIGNISSGNNSAVVGGCLNCATACYASVVNGINNKSLGIYSFIGGGLNNCALSTIDVILSGCNNTTRLGLGSGIIAGSSNCTAYGCYNLLSGLNNTIQGTGTGICGANFNTSVGSTNVICGVRACYNAIFGGGNVINGGACSLILGTTNRTNSVGVFMTGSGNVVCSSNSSHVSATFGSTVCRSSGSVIIAGSCNQIVPSKPDGCQGSFNAILMATCSCIRGFSCCTAYNQISSACGSSICFQGVGSAKGNSLSGIYQSISHGSANDQFGTDFGELNYNQTFGCQNGVSSFLEVLPTSQSNSGNSFNNYIKGIDNSIYGSIVNTIDDTKPFRVLNSINSITGNTNTIGSYLTNSLVCASPYNGYYVESCNNFIEGENNRIEFSSIDSIQGQSVMSGNRIFGQSNTICAISCGSTQSGQVGVLFYNAILGGDGNTICADETFCSCSAYTMHNTIINGHSNVICNTSPFINNSIILQGCCNVIFNAPCSFIGNGCFNIVTGSYSSVLNGRNNCVSGNYSTISSGYCNYITGERSFIGGGSANKACYLLTGIGSGYANVIEGQSAGSFIGGGYVNYINSAYSMVGGGNSNCIFGCSSFIGGGQGNNITSTSFNGAIVGGFNNFVCGACAFVGSGSQNKAVGAYSGVVLGNTNCATACYAGVFGGQSNIASCVYSFIAGCGITSRMACALHTNRLVITNVPTSSAGLPSGAVWSNAGVLTIVP